MKMTDKIRRLLTKGKTAKEIAAKLKIEPNRVHTVKWLDKKAAKNVRPEQNPDPAVRKAEKTYIKKVNKAFKRKGRPASVEKQIHDIRAEAWKARNPWFGVDEHKTAEALKYHEQLVQAGFDPLSDAYWDTVEMRFNGKPKIRLASAVKPLLTSDEADALLKPIEAGKDVVNHPPHYKAGGIETIDFIEAKDLNYRLGNVIKYVSRAGKKESDPIVDLKKARWYLDREIFAREGA